jgi:two-component system, LytTR family, sensor kinase
VFSLRYRYLFILLLAVYSFLNILFTVGTKLLDVEIPYFYLFGLIGVEILLVWELNRFVERRLSSLHQVLGKKIHALIILFVCSMVNVVIASILSLGALYAVLQHDIVWSTNHLVLVLAFGFRVNLFLNCLNAIYYYMERLKKSELKAERLEKVSIEAQFEALRNQINPHFLFNCFNALSTLVYKDADTSAKFIAQLSKVYRYLLYNQEKKIVSLNEELEFMDSYLFLLKIRFGDNISIEKNISADANKFFIAPASLQMLIENAIKHNVVSTKNPLKIKIISQNGSIEVINNLQEKAVKEDSTFIGLKNIKKRYEFLSDIPVEIVKTHEEFRVKIPLLQLEN